MSDVIRPARRADVPELLRLINDLARYEEAQDQVTATEPQLVSTLFNDRPMVYAIVAEDQERLVAMAFYYYSFSTWQGRYGLYMKDMFVEPDYRQQGLGRAMMARLAAIAQKHNCGRFEWSVLDWNDPAIAFYRKCGAEPKAEWVRYRLDGDSLQALAEKDESEEE